MKKLMTTGLCLLALLWYCWVAATLWLQARIEHEIRQAILASQPELVTATHGPVTVSFWNRTVAIADIVLTTRGANAAALMTIGSVTAFDVHHASGTLSVGRIVGHDIRYWGPLPANPMSRAHFVLPSVMVDTVTLRTAAAAASFSGLSVNAIRVLELKSTTVLPSKMLIEQTHHNIAVRAIRDGTIGRLDIGHSAITTTLPGDKPLVVEINDGSLADIDIGLIAELLDGAAPATTGVGRHKPVLRYGSTGAVTVYREGAVAATCASLEVSNVAIDASLSGTAVRALKAALPAPGHRLSRKQEQAMQDAIVTLYENVATDWLKINGLTWAPGTLPVGRGQGSIASLQMHNLIDGKIAQMRITGLDAITFADTPTYSPSHDSLVIGRSLFHNLNLVELTRLPARLVTSGMKLPPVAILWPLAIRLFERIDAEQVLVTTGLQRDGTAIDTLRASWGPVIGQTPTSGQIQARFNVPIDGSTALATLLRGTGLNRADMNVTGHWHWREATKTLDFGPVDLAIADIGSASTTLQLTNVARLALIARPDLLPAAIQAITLGPVNITLRDQGLLKLLSKDPDFPAQRQRTIAQYQTLVGGDGNSRALLKTSGPDVLPPWRAFADSMAQFLARPGQRLVISLTPTAAVSLGSLLASSQSGGQIGGQIGGMSGVDLVRHLAPQIVAAAAVH